MSQSFWLKHFPKVIYKNMPWRQQETGTSSYTFKSTFCILIYVCINTDVNV